MKTNISSPQSHLTQYQRHYPHIVRSQRIGAPNCMAITLFHHLLASCPRVHGRRQNTKWPNRKHCVAPNDDDDDTSNQEASHNPE